MPEAGKRPCTICRRWFRPDPRVGERQRACTAPECRSRRRQRTQASWRRRNPDYAAAYRIDHRAKGNSEPLRLPAPLDQLPWDLAKDQFGTQGADFIGLLGTLLVRSTKDQFRAQVADSKRDSDTLRPRPEKTSPSLGHTDTRTRNATGMAPTGPVLGAPPGARSAPPGATDGFAG